jgi:Ser/Thr protein kinase RdoA (MazF antagonist)
MTAAPDGVTPAAVAAEFGLGDPLGPLTVASGGKQGVVHDLRTTRGRFAVKRLLVPLTEAAAETDLRLLETALGRGIHVPAPVRSRHGTVLAGVDGALLRVFTWVDLHRPRTDLDPAALGTLLGTLHRDPLPAVAEQPPPGGSPSSDGPRVDPWYTDPVPEPVWHRLTEQLAAAGAPFAAEFAATAPLLAGWQPAFEPPGRLQLCHRDLWADNLRGTPDGRLCVIDWDTAGPADPAGEVAMLLTEFCYRDAERAAVLATAYRAAGGTALPQRPGDFTMVLAQFGHFAQTAAEDWLTADGPQKDAEQADAEAWFRELLDRPLVPAEVDHLLAAVRLSR